MADKKLSELTELAATPASDDEVYIHDVSEATDKSKRITIANLLTLINNILIQELVIIPEETDNLAQVNLRNADSLENFGYVTFAIWGSNVLLMPGQIGTGQLPTKFTCHLDIVPSLDNANGIGWAGRSWSDVHAYHHGLTQILGTDHTWWGLTAPMKAGMDLTIGQSVQVGNDTLMRKTLADSTTTMPAIALATGSIADNTVGSFLMQGFMRDDSWNWTPSGLIYIDPTTAGTLTQTLPSTTGYQVQEVGVAITANIIYFNPSLTIVEIS